MLEFLIYWICRSLEFVFEFLVHWIYRYTDIFLAPFYYHCGRNWLFIEIIVFLSNVVETLGLPFIMFFFITIILICINPTLRNYIKNFYKNYLSFSNFLFLFTYVFSLLNSFLKSILSLAHKIYFFFKKKNK